MFFLTVQFYAFVGCDHRIFIRSSHLPWACLQGGLDKNSVNLLNTNNRSCLGLPLGGTGEVRWKKGQLLFCEVVCFVILFDFPPKNIPLRSILKKNTPGLLSTSTPLFICILYVPTLRYLTILYSLLMSSPCALQSVQQLGKFAGSVHMEIFPSEGRYMKSSLNSSESPFGVTASCSGAVEATGRPLCLFVAPFLFVRNKSRTFLPKDWRLKVSHWSVKVRASILPSWGDLVPNNCDRGSSLQGNVSRRIWLFGTVSSERRSKCTNNRLKMGAVNQIILEFSWELNVNCVGLVRQSCVCNMEN